jgi:methylenetetrahydrofolate reductase (NADPH)
LRTESWDEFPNGRWGDSRSPAYGELDRYGLTIKYTKDETLALWSQPKTLDELRALFVGYCAGTVRALPWCEQALAEESDTIRKRLISLNQRGYLTINSQPCVNGEQSSHPVYGWVCRQQIFYQFFLSNV